jgi:hypothetical protein
MYGTLSASLHVSSMFLADANQTLGVRVGAVPKLHFKRKHMYLSTAWHIESDYHHQIMQASYTIESLASITFQLLFPSSASAWVTRQAKIFVRPTRCESMRLRR